jgi:hypothetical protein
MAVRDERIITKGRIVICEDDSDVKANTLGTGLERSIPFSIAFLQTMHPLTCFGGGCVLIILKNPIRVSQAGQGRESV